MEKGLNWRNLLQHISFQVSVDIHAFVLKLVHSINLIINKSLCNKYIINALLINMCVLVHSLNKNIINIDNKLTIIILFFLS